MAQILGAHDLKQIIIAVDEVYEQSVIDGTARSLQAAGIRNRGSQGEQQQPAAQRVNRAHQLRHREQPPTRCLEREWLSTIMRARDNAAPAIAPAPLGLSSHQSRGARPRPWVLHNTSLEKGFKVQAEAGLCHTQNHHGSPRSRNFSSSGVEVRASNFLCHVTIYSRVDVFVPHARTGTRAAASRFKRYEIDQVNSGAGAAREKEQQSASLGSCFCQVVVLLLFSDQQSHLSSLSHVCEAASRLFHFLLNFDLQTANRRWIIQNSNLTAIASARNTG